MYITRAHPSNLIMPSHTVTFSLLQRLTHSPRVRALLRIERIAEWQEEFLEDIPEETLDRMDELYEELNPDDLELLEQARYSNEHYMNQYDLLMRRIDMAQSLVSHVRRKAAANTIGAAFLKALYNPHTSIGYRKAQRLYDENFEA